MNPDDSAPDALLWRSLADDRVHSAYLLSGPGDAPRESALRFLRAMVCTGSGARPCEACIDCRRSSAPNDVALDGNGKRGPFYRHVGDHADLVWVARGAEDTRVRIAQVRALQAQLRLRASGAGRRAALVEGAEWLNAEAQNALLHLLEEPPRATTIVLVASTAAGLLATLRSRCQRVRFPVKPASAWLGEDASESVQALAARMDAIRTLRVVDVLDWAEEFRGARAESASAVEELLETATAWLHREISRRAEAGDPALGSALDAFATVRAARRGFVQRNANSQMVAERTLLALREAFAP